MKTITIKIEDLPNNRVKVTMDPSGYTIAKMIISGEKTTNAHGLALRALNAILDEKRSHERGKIIIPN